MFLIDPILPPVDVPWDEVVDCDRDGIGLTTLLPPATAAETPVRSDVIDVDHIAIHTLQRQ
jgi:hypothetical protein